MLDYRRPAECVVQKPRFVDAKRCKCFAEACGVAEPQASRQSVRSWAINQASRAALQRHPLNARAEEASC